MQLTGESLTEAPAVRVPIVARVFRSYLALDWQAHVVVVTALVAMAYVQLTIPLYWGRGDPLDYYSMARLFLHKPDGSFIPWRPPGMALFLILTGVAWLDTFKVLVVLYAAMSVAIPVLIYVILRRYSRTWGMVAALIAIVGAVPYAYSRVLWPEQLFHFLHFVVLALVAAYLARPANSRLPYAIALAMFALNLVRPVAALYYWIFLGCALVLVWRPLRHVALATAVYVGLMGGWALADRYYGASLFPTVYMPETAAQRMFGEVYYSGGPYQFVPERPPVAAIQTGDGAASRAVYAGLRWVVRTAPDLWQQPNAERPALLFARYAGQPEEFVRVVMSKPNFAYFDFLRHALQARYGAAGAERVMYGVAREHGDTGVRGVARYFAHNPTKLLVGGLPPSAGRYLLGAFYFLQADRYRNLIVSLQWPWAPSKCPPLPLNGPAVPVDEPGDPRCVPGLALLDPHNGPASKEFFASVAFFIRAYPMYWEHTNAWLGAFKGNPDGLYRATFDLDRYNPVRGLYEAFYWEALNKYYGVGPADRLFVRVALETMRSYPRTVALFWDKTLHIVLLRTLGDIKTPASPLMFSTTAGDIGYAFRQNDSTGLAGGLGGELRERIFGDANSNLIGYAYGTMHFLAPVFVFGAFVLFGFGLLSSARRLMVFLALAYAYDVAAIAVFGNFSAPRYEDVFILLPVMLACLGVHFAIVSLRSRQGAHTVGR